MTDPGDNAAAATAVFVHGLFSSSSTWNPLIDLLKADPLMSRVAITTFDYPSPYVRFNRLKAIPNIDVLADSLSTFLDNLVPDRAGPILLIGHSQGGLIIQRFLHRTLGHGHGDNLDPIRAIILLACPNGGSDLLVGLRRVLFGKRNAQINGLFPLNTAVAEAHQTVIERVIYATTNSESAHKITVKTFAGMEDKVVTEASARGAFPRVGVLPGDHFSILKPDDSSDLRYKVVQREILAAVHVNVEGNRNIVGSIGEGQLREDSIPRQVERIAEILDTQYALPIEEVTLESLAKQFRGQQVTTQRVEDAAIAELLSLPTIAGLNRVLQTMAHEQVISQYGVRVRLVDTRVDIYVRMLLVDETIQAIIERRDGSSVEALTWSQHEDFLAFMGKTADSLRRNSLMPRDFEPTFWLRELVTALFRLRTEKRRFTLVENLDGALEYCSPQWAIYDWGLAGWYEHRHDPYVILASQMNESDWIPHMQEKTWVDMDSFEYAIGTARLLMRAGRIS